MSKRRNTRYGRDAPAAAPQKRSAVTLTSLDAWKVLCGDAYKPIAQCPEVQMCVGAYADLLGNMTIHLMANTEDGDTRIRNELSRKLDIEPSRYLTRSGFMQWIVRTLMTEGNAFVMPRYRGELLDDLQPMPPGEVSMTPDGDGYKIQWRGRFFSPDEVLHFALNPDRDQPWRGRGYTVSLREIVRSIRQVNATKKAILESPAPSIIVKVDGLTEEFADTEGRKKLREQYLDASETGEPWFIPAEAFSVEQVKPLTLNDLAIKANLDMDKRSMAAIFGVPAFMVGIGAFDKAEYHYFLTARVMSIAKIIEQELTKKLLYSESMYWRLNARSLYNYSLTELMSVGVSLVDRMAMRRNELRDWLGLPPDPEMQDILALENYIPADRLGDQKKLEQEGGEGNGDQGNETDPELG